MHDKAVDIYLITFCDDVDCCIITFLNDDMVFKIMDFDINLDNDDSFDEDDLERWWRW